MFQKGVLVGVVLKRPDLPDRLQMRGVVERPQYGRAVGVPVDLAESGDVQVHPVELGLERLYQGS